MTVTPRPFRNFHRRTADALRWPLFRLRFRASPTRGSALSLSSRPRSHVGVFCPVGLVFVVVAEDRAWSSNPSPRREPFRCAAKSERDGLAGWEEAEPLAPAGPLPWVVALVVSRGGGVGAPGGIGGLGTGRPGGAGLGACATWPTWSAGAACRPSARRPRSTHEQRRLPPWADARARARRQAAAERRDRRPVADRLTTVIAASSRGRPGRRPRTASPGAARPRHDGRISDASRRSEVAWGRAPERGKGDAGPGSPRAAVA